MMTDRQRVELSLPIHIMFTVVTAGVRDPQEEAVHRVKALLLAAATEPVADLQQVERNKILRRVERTHRDVVEPFMKAEAPVSKVGLLCFYMLQWLVDAGYFVVGEESSFKQALDLLLPGLEHEVGSDIDHSAKKQARRCLSKLQALGYYQGVTAGN